MRKMTQREIKHNWLQFLSMIVITLLAVTLFCGFLSNTKTLSYAVDDFYEKTNLCDICVQVYSFTDDDKAYLESLGDVQYRFYEEGTINGSGAKIYAGGSMDEASISRPQMLDGDATGAVIASTGDSFFIGEEVTLSMSFGTLSLDLTATVSGHMNFAEASSDAYTSTVYLTDEYARELISSTAAGRFLNLDSLYDQALYKSSDPAALKAQINDYYTEKAGENLIFIYDRSNMETPVMLSGEISQSNKMIYVFPVIFLIVSVFVILTTENRLISDDRTEIGTLKALGLSRREITFHYAGMGAILCLIGGILGAITGPFVVPSVMKAKYTIVYGLIFPAIPRINVWGSILAVLAIVLLAALIGVLVCMGVVKQTPADSMRPIPPEGKRYKKGQDEDISQDVPAQNTAAQDATPCKKAKKITFAGDKNLAVKMASRNILIKPFRALVTVLGITGCVALSVCSFGIGDTVDNSIDLELHRQFTYDITTTYSDADFEEKALKIEGIESVETYTVYYMTCASGDMTKDIKVYNMPASMTMTTIDTSQDKVSISKSTAKYLGVSEGDKITLSASSKTFTYEIDDIIETAVTQGLFLYRDELNNSGLYGTSSAFLRLREGTVCTDEMLDEVNEAAGTLQAASVEGRADYIDDKISSISTMEITLMIFAILLSVVVVYNLSLLNIRERTRDIATMKVLGIKNTKIALSLLYEILILAILGTALGLCLGFPVTYLVLSINSVEIMSFIYCVKPISYVYSALISLAAAVIINLIFSIKIPKINMTESLKSAE